MIFRLEYSVLTEANSVYHCLSKVLSGFYLQNGWYVLPPSTQVSMDSPIAILPELDYKECTPASNRLAVDLSTLIQKNPKVVTAIQSQLVKHSAIKEISDRQLTALKNKYCRVLSPAIQKSILAIDYLRDKQFLIEIYPTHYGTGRTVSRPSLTDDLIHIQMFINPAFPPEVTVELFSTAIINSALDKDIHNWREKEAISDYVTRHLFSLPNYYGTLQTMQHRKPKLLHKSLSYLRDLNLPTGTILTYDLSTDSITLLNNDITDTFGPYEKRLLKILLRNQGKIVTFDTVAESMYPNNTDDRFSLWGITKTLQRVRNKLEIFGIPRTYIQNVKGEGYFVTK